MAQSEAHGGFGPVLGWLSTMQSSGTAEEKTVAHENLENFQKSVGSPFFTRKRHLIIFFNRLKHGLLHILSYHLKLCLTRQNCLRLRR